MRKPWLSTIYEVLNYKFEELTEKIKEKFVDLATDYKRTGSLDKFIALHKDELLTEDKLSELEAFMQKDKNETFH